jgi:hypothetical protein
MIKDDEQKEKYNVKIYLNIYIFMFKLFLKKSFT